MITNPDNQFIQRFRCSSTNRVGSIPAHQDPETMHHVIFMEDIQTVFRNATIVKNNGVMVPFMRDAKSLRFTPWRIPYHPNTELMVSEEASGSDNRSANVSSVNEINATADTNITDNPSATSTDQITSKTVSVSPDRDVPKLFGAIMEGVTEIKQNQQVINDRVDMIQQKQQVTNDGVDMIQQKQQVTNDGVREVLQQVAIIQNRIKALLNQNYELHEYPVPRLFIILPRNPGSLKDRIKGFVADHYRLYFLCECGIHIPEVQNRIHLAKHEGYELLRPNDFMQKYGSRLVTILRVVQTVITAAGSLTGPMANLDVLEKIADELKCLKKDVSPVIDAAIKYLENIPSDQEIPDRPEALEGPELRKLVTYLKIKDDEQAFGNLYRIVDDKGHVRWVCLDHYREDYRESTREQLRGIIEVNGGQYIEEIGEIRISLENNDQARVFYDKLVRSRGVHVLVITLKWDATMYDIQALVDAVTEANVVDLTVDGSHFKRPWDVINRKQRFNPLMWLSSNGRIQYLKLQGFKTFFRRVNQLPRDPYPRLRVFSMDSGDLLSRRNVRSFKRFLIHNPPLTTLKLRLGEKCSPLATITKDIIEKLTRLQSLSIDYGEISITLCTSDGKVHGVDLTIERFTNFANELEFIQRDHLRDLTRLVVKRTPQESDECHLIDILSVCTKLTQLRIGCEGQRAPAIVDLVISTLQKYEKTSLREFNLMEEMLVPFNVYEECDDSTHIQTCLTFDETPDSFDMQTWVRLGNKMSIYDVHPVNDFVRKYGWSIVFLEENWTLNDRVAAILDHIPSTRNSRLEALSFEASKFTDSRFEQLGTIIKDPRNLKRLGLRLELIEIHQCGTVCSLIEQYWSVIFKLQLYGKSSMFWLQLFALLFRTRARFPSLESLEVSFDPHPNFKVPENCIDWIAAMISSSPQDSKSSSTQGPESSSAQGSESSSSQGSESSSTQGPESPSTQGPESSSSTQGSATPWKRMKKIVLRHIHLQHDEWKKIIDAMEFTELEHLDLRSSNLSQKTLSLLVGRMTGAAFLPMKILNIEDTGLQKNAALDLMFSEIVKSAPMAKIINTVM
ncbi:hypothetical protein B0O80DRAFT_502565 [Mortierella sp. GBAus27b]|nr:hypothetical protein BGX31_009813 [Mortierella sp. GBA43]KAI8347761.1 hypothetical protein B0O80DRAFT_502565 [Mortierella sp. GBAus27b]